MRKTIFFCLSVLLPVLVAAQDANEVFRQFRPKICLVQFYKNVSSQSQIGSYIKIKQYRIGVIVSPEGLVMVNSDVYPLSLDIISGNGASYSSGEPSDFRVKLHDGREYHAEFVGKDEQAQAAFIRITNELESPLPFVSFVSSEVVRIGDPVYLLELLGESYQFEPLFTPYSINAIIKEPRRKLLITNAVTALSAGGLIITQKGQAVGVTLRNDFDFSFAPPQDFEEFRKDFLEIAPSEWLSGLIENPPVLARSDHQGKSWLGINMQALTPELAEYWGVDAKGGVVVDRVYPNSPAQRGGLKVKDVVLRMNDQPLLIKKDEELNRFREMITQHPPNSEIQLTIFRDGKTLEKKIKLLSAPKAIDLAAKYQSKELGIEVRELTADVLYDDQLPLDTKGVYVFQVDRASPAGFGGLEAGSIITEVNGRPVRDLEDFRKIIEQVKAEKGHKIMLRTQMREETRFVFLDVK